MESEDERLARLRPIVPPPAPNAPTETEPTKPEGNPSDFNGEFELDDLTKFKLHEYFGQKFKTYDTDTIQRVEYIYKTAAEIAGSSEYGQIISTIRSMEQMLGSYNSDNRLYKMYEWMRLDNARRRISTEMRALQS